MATKQAKRAGIKAEDLPKPIIDELLKGPIPFDTGLLRDPEHRYTSQRAIRAVEGRCWKKKDSTGS